MHAVVEIAYGIPTWKRTKTLLQDKLQALDLRGTYAAITIYPEWENVQDDSSENSCRLRRVLLAAFHPQNMMRAWSKTYAAGQDRLLEVGHRPAVLNLFHASAKQRSGESKLNSCPTLNLA
jgi:hypothetical protein